MRKFFIDADQAAKAEADKLIEIRGGDVNHIVNVLRMKKGDVLHLCATDGREFEAGIESFDSSCVRAEVLSVSKNTTEPDVRVTLIQGVPKGDKMELIIQKAVELGACEIIPAMTEHTVVRLNESEGNKKQARWQKIAEEASKQCGRGIVPRVASPVSLKAALENRPEEEVKLFAYENEEETSLKKILTELGENFRGAVSVVIGPEGGFSLAEAEFARGCGFRAFSLGRRILRTETAGMAALSGIRCFFED
jgi:16S rRNA (uracil1498-N3)-methyltransferase